MTKKLNDVGRLMLKRQLYGKGCYAEGSCTGEGFTPLGDVAEGCKKTL